MPRLFTSTRFRKNFKKQSGAIQQLASEREKIFLANSFDPRLGTHKLHGKDSEQWSYAITRKIRIKFTFVTPNIVMYLVPH